MSHQLTDYLSRETADYLDQLERVLATPGELDAEQLLQLARRARGSAEMAGLDRIAHVAELLEAAAASRASHGGGWSPGARDAALETVRDLQRLVRAVHTWGPDEDAVAQRALHRWSDSTADAPDADPEVVPIESLFFDDEGPHILPGPGDGANGEDREDGDQSGDPVVPIGELLLTGEAALREALRLRPEVEQLLVHSDRPEAGDLVTELFELMELALPSEGPSDE